MNSVIRAFIHREKGRAEGQVQEEWDQLEKDIDRWDIFIIIPAIRSWLASYEGGTSARHTVYQQFLAALEK